jgi:hypothetical protein
MPKPKHLIQIRPLPVGRIPEVYGKMTPSYYPTGPTYPTSDAPGAPWRPLHIVSGLVVAFVLSFIATMTVLSASGC